MQKFGHPWPFYICGWFESENWLTVLMTTDDLPNVLTSQIKIKSCLLSHLIYTGAKVSEGECVAPSFVLSPLTVIVPNHSVVYSETCPRLWFFLITSFLVLPPPPVFVLSYSLCYLFWNLPLTVIHRNSNTIGSEPSPWLFLVLITTLFVMRPPPWLWLVLIATVFVLRPPLDCDWS